MAIGQVLFLLIDLVIGLGIGAVAVYFVMRSRVKSVQRDLDVEQVRLLEEAQLKAKQMELAAKDEAIKVRDEAEGEANKPRAEWQREEERLARKREDLESKTGTGRSARAHSCRVLRAGSRNGSALIPLCLH